MTDILPIASAVYYKKGLYRKALECLDKAAKLTSDDPTIMEHIGDTYLKLNLPQKALEYYRLALEKKENEKTDLQEKIRELETRGF